MVLTAAHCLDVPPDSPFADVAIPLGTANLVYATVEYARSGDGRTCISVPNDSGDCDYATYVFFERQATGTHSNNGNDFAAVFTPSADPWSNLGGLNKVSTLYSGPLSAGEEFTAWGAGFDGSDFGTMHKMDGELSAVKTSYVENFNPDSGGCSGDSGGPYFFDGTRHQFALFRGFLPYRKPPACATVLDTSVATRITGLRMLVLNDWRNQLGLGACTRLPGGYKDFWTCP